MKTRCWWLWSCITLLLELELELVLVLVLGHDETVGAVVVAA